METKILKWSPDFPKYGTNDKDRPKYIRPKSIKPFAMIICSSRNQGKSSMIRHLYENFFESKYDIVIVFSKTLGNGFYEQFINSRLMFEKFDQQIIDNVLDKQEDIKEEKGFYYNILMIFDDMLGNDVKYSETVSDLFTMGRHKGISIIFATQNPVMCHQSWRQNTTHLIFLRAKGRGRDHIIDNFLLDLVDEDYDTGNLKAEPFLRDLIKKIFEQRYRAIVVEYDKQNIRLSETLFYYIADVHFKKRRK